MIISISRFRSHFLPCLLAMPIENSKPKRNKNPFSSLGENDYPANDNGHDDSTSSKNSDSPLIQNANLQVGF